LHFFVQDFTASNRFVLDYLAQEVFERQTQEIQDFLLKTSILDRLCGSLCEAITELPGSQELLETLERSNLFILPLDQSRIWYRYHRLFCDLLRSRLRNLETPALQALHRQASLWYENHQLLPDAVQHSLACDDWERALNLIHNISDAMLKHGEIFTLLDWYSQVPDHLILGDAIACLDYSWSLMLSGQFERAAIHLSHAEGHAGQAPSFSGQIFNAEAFLARAQGDHQRMVELSQKAQALLPKEDLNSRCMASTNLGIAYWHSGKMDAAEHALSEALETGIATENFYAVSSALVFQGMVMAVRGRLREARDHFQSLVKRTDYPIFFRGLAYLYLGVLHYEWNDLEQSGKSLLEAIEIGERIRNDELLVISWMMMARIHMAGGNLATAGDVLDKAYQKALEGDAPNTTVPRLAAVRVQLAIACDDLESASAWGEHLAEDCDWHNFYRFTNTTQALLLLAQNKNRAAAVHLEQGFKKASQEGWVYGKIAIRSLQALAASEPEAAFKYLQDGLNFAQPEGYMRTFVDLGKGLEPLLQMALRRKVLPDYAEEILSAMHAGTHKPILGQLSLVEPLNPRELEVLRLLAAGMTNREIANSLFVSTGTVKTHVHNIYGKLGARNRTEAAARARELGFV
jgi:LuxR family maltose regulon positive regulatory protein